MFDRTRSNTYFELRKKNVWAEWHIQEKIPLRFKKIDVIRCNEPENGNLFVTYLKLAFWTAFSNHFVFTHCQY